MLEYALIEGFKSDLEFATGPVWIEALPARLYKTPEYGDVPVTVEKLQRMIKNFKENVRGQKIAINYNHGRDVSKGDKAAGWISDLALKPSSDDPNQMSLYTALEFTDQAAQEVSAEEWKYLSMEWDDLWMSNSGQKFEDVVTGVALTNRPIAKGMAALPVNFSEQLWNELEDDEKKEFAVLSSAERKSLPDSAFLYVSGGERHLPYRNAGGGIDMNHLRNAITRLSQKATGTVNGETWLTESTRSRLLVKARSLLGAKSKNMSEEVIEAIESDTLVLVDEVREWEHSEPGTGPTPAIGNPTQDDPGTGQPVPRKQGDPAKEESDIGGGWRREPLPTNPDNRNEGGSALTPEELAELKVKLGLKEDATPAEIIATAGVAFSENTTLKTLVSAASEEKRFAEEYPTVWAEQQRLKAESADNRAKAFSESASKITRTEGEKQVATKLGLSALAIEQIKETHKKFSEGTVTSEDFEKAIAAIVNGGVVEFGESGSNLEDDDKLVDVKTGGTPQAIAANRKLFAEKIAEIQEKDELEFLPALKLAGERYPELAAVYAQTV